MGNLDARRDWGHARDFVRGMWMILQQEAPGDYVLATGETHSVRHFVETAFRRIGIDIEWRGTGLEERGFDSESGQVLVEIDPRYFRPTEVDLLLGDPTKARAQLGWRHERSLDEIVAEMVREDLKIMARSVPQTQPGRAFAHA